MSGVDKTKIEPSFNLVTTSGVVPAAAQKTGTITSSGTNVTGTDTLFKTLLQTRVGDYIYAQNQVRQITAIFNDLRVSVNRGFSPDISIGVDLYVIRATTNLDISISNRGAGNVSINTINYDSKLLEEGESIGYSSKNGLGPIAYVTAGSTVEISNGEINKSGTSTVAADVNANIISPIGATIMADSVSVTIATDQTDIPVVLGGGEQVFTSTLVTNDSTITAGATSIKLTTSSDYAGNINGVARAVSMVYSFEAAPGKTLPAITYTTTTGSILIDKIV